MWGRRGAYAGCHPLGCQLLDTHITSFLSFLFFTSSNKASCCLDCKRCSIWYKHINPSPLQPLPSMFAHPYTPRRKHAYAATQGSNSTQPHTKDSLRDTIHYKPRLSKENREHLLPGLTALFKQGAGTHSYPKIPVA